MLSENVRVVLKASSSPEDVSLLEVRLLLDLVRLLAVTLCDFISQLRES